MNKIAYLGPEGTFSQMAARQAFKKKNYNFIAAQTIEDIFNFVSVGKCAYGVIPIENSNAGSVNITLDIFCNENYNLCICKEIFLKINFHLLSNAKSLKKIKLVYAHEMAHAQCRLWLKSKLSGVIIKSAGSNSLAAKMAVNNPESAAISNSLSASAYNINILAKNINDYKNNVTRFLVIGKKEAKPAENNKTSLLFSVKHKPGSLFGILKFLAKRNINMTRIESRIMKKGNWEYHFFVDLEGHIKNKIIKEAVEEMQDGCKSFKVLGSYPKGKAPWNKND